MRIALASIALWVATAAGVWLWIDECTWYGWDAHMGELREPICVSDDEQVEK